MAPEQIQGKDVDSRTDIFSLGVMLYELLTKKKPFQGENLTQVSHRIVYDEYTSPGEFVEDLPPNLLVILERALSKNPDERYQDAAEMARDLRAALHGDLVESRPKTLNCPDPGHFFGENRCGGSRAEAIFANSSRSETGFPDWLLDSAATMLVVSPSLSDSDPPGPAAAAVTEGFEPLPPPDLPPTSGQAAARGQATLLAEARRLAGEGDVPAALIYLQSACEKEICSSNVQRYYLELADQAAAEDDIVEAYVTERMAIVETYLRAKRYEEALSVLELILLADYRRAQDRLQNPNRGGRACPLPGRRIG